MFFDFMGNIYTLSVSVHPAELWGGRDKVGTPIQTNRERSGEDVENSGPLDVKFSIVHFYL